MEFIIAILVWVTALLHNPYGFESYRKEFETQFNVNTTNIDIQFVDGDTLDGAVAVCWKASNFIAVEQPRWDSLSRISREQLIMHELGHCALSLKHDDHVKEDGCKRSIMHPTLFGGVDTLCYILNKDLYIEQMKWLKTKDHTY